VWGKLHRLYSTVLGSTRYLGIEAISSPMPVGKDESERWMISANFTVTKERG
jgi:hypothetical protein